jgi:hypothetical protein
MPGHFLSTSPKDRLTRAALPERRKTPVSFINFYIGYYFFIPLVFRVTISTILCKWTVVNELFDWTRHINSENESGPLKILRNAYYFLLLIYSKKKIMFVFI